MKIKKQQIEKIILQNISSYNFSVELLAEELNISTSYLRETTYHYFFMSPQKMIESYKLEKAILMFRKGSSIEMVKRETGYINSRTFRRVFKKRLNITPHHCIEILKEGNHSLSTVKKLLKKVRDPF